MRMVANFVNTTLLRKTLQGADTIIHTAALDAPYVGMVPDHEFEWVKVKGTRLLVKAA